MLLQLTAPQILTAEHKLSDFDCGQSSSDPIPVMVLARLAVNQPLQGVGLGVALLQDAVLRATAIANQTGVRAILVHAIDEAAKRFYTRFGFAQSPINPMTLLLRIQVSD